MFRQDNLFCYLICIFCQVVVLFVLLWKIKYFSTCVVLLRKLGISRIKERLTHILSWVAGIGEFLGSRERSVKSKQWP